MKGVLVALFLAGCGKALATEASYDCVPGMPCWPSASEWQALNQSIGGRLIRTVPWAAPCYISSPHYNRDVCSAIQDGYTTGLERETVYGSMQAVQYEVCGDKGCLLQSIAPELPPLLQTCDLGRLSAYHVDARDGSHVAAAINFARKHNIRLSVKSTGHDYLGRSVAPNTLAIWTHNLATTRYYPTFTAKNCPSVQRTNVGEMGAGVLARDAYPFFQDYNMAVCGGNAASVGLAGGFGLGGGHGVFTPIYGLLVDQAIEFDVVTADGQLRTINECNDPDLFWAMRGGGGTYAVLLAYRFQLYPAIPIHMHHFKASFSLIGESFSNSSIVRALVTAHVTNQTYWSENSITGRFYYGYDFAEFHTILPYDDDGTKIKEVTKNWLNGIQSIPGLTVEMSEYDSYEKYSDYNAVAQEAAARLTPNGFAANVASRLLPRSLFSPESTTSLVNAVLEGLDINFGISNIMKSTPGLEVMMTTPVHTPDTEGATSVHPDWRKSLWHAAYMGGWTKGTPLSMQQSIIERINNAAQPLRNLTPGGGSYANEDSILVEDWQSTFWGPNYDKLLSIKNKYDPTHLFDCYKCVGWRGANE